MQQIPVQPCAVSAVHFLSSPWQPPPGGYHPRSELRKPASFWRFEPEASDRKATVSHLRDPLEMGGEHGFSWDSSVKLNRGLFGAHLDVLRLFEDAFPGRTSL